VSTLTCPTVAGAPQPGFHLAYSLPVQPHVVGGAFFMGPINERLVQRTWGLLERERRLAPDDAAAGAASYGAGFTYEEMMVTPKWLGAFGGAMVSAFVALTFAACVVPPVCCALVRAFCRSCSYGRRCAGFSGSSSHRGRALRRSTSSFRLWSGLMLTSVRRSFDNSSLTLTNVTSSAADAATPVPIHVRTTMVLRGEAGYFLTSSPFRRSLSTSAVD
jgi:hypothetical protein